MASYYNHSPNINKTIDIGGYKIEINNPYGVPLRTDIPAELAVRLKYEPSALNSGYQLKEGASKYKIVTSERPLSWCWFYLDTDMEPKGLMRAQ